MLYLLLVTAFANELLYKKQFSEFKINHGKNYTTYEEHLQRFEIFKDNLREIEEHNAKGLPWTKGVTQFADMTAYEFTMYVKRGNGGGFVPQPEEMRNVVELPKAKCTDVDWVAQGKVTPVKNQGQCGSCWSFSTTGAIEGRSAIASGTLNSLSEQQLVDCDTTQDHGCNGGLMDYGFEYVQQNGGLCSETDYPYKAKDGASCLKSQCQTKYDPISSHADVNSEDEDSLESAICDGPVSIAIEADQSSFQLYTGGVLTSDSCGKSLDHGVLLVGMGTDGGNDYWKVKNSWGPTWGEEGYIRLCRNCKKNCGWLGGCAGQCGLMKQPSYPVV
jgi:C1A family cysteine protease